MIFKRLSNGDLVGYNSLIDEKSIFNRPRVRIPKTVVEELKTYLKLEDWRRSYFADLEEKK